ncbi:MAG: DUF4340 domain-containing protein, partial [FCB group bacterium]|nr:DUF4340 domain-containing protein [FCB group bacterium]
MKPKQLAILAIVTAVLVGLVLLKERQDKPADITIEAGLTPLVPQDIKADDIAKIEFYQGEAPDKKVVLARAGDGTTWMTPSQFNAPVSKEKMDAFLEKMAGLKGEARPVNEGADALESYELTEPKSFHVLLYKKDEDKPVAHLLSGKAADYQTAFVRPADSNKVYQTNVNLRTDAGINPNAGQSELTAEAWVDKQIVKFEPDTIERIAMAMPDKQLVIEQKEMPAEEAKPEDAAATPEAPKPAPVAEWAVAEGAPEGKAIKDGAAPAFLRGIESLYAIGVVDPAKAAEYGLEQPLFRATLKVKGQEAETVIEGGRPNPDSDDAYLRVVGKPGNPIYHVTPNTFENVFPKGEKLFALAEIAAEPTSVNRVEFTQPEGNVVIVRENGAWKVESPLAGFSPQTNTLDTIAATLAQWHAEDYAQSAEGRGLETPQRQVTFTVAPDQQHTIALGNPSQSTAGNYARLDSNPTALVMAKSSVDKVFVKPADLFERTLLNATALDIMRIAATYGETSFDATRGEGQAQWTLTLNGAPQPANGANLENLASALVGIQATEILFDKAALDAAPIATVQFNLNGADNVLSIGPEVNGSHQATLTGKDKVFLLAPEDVMTLLATKEVLVNTAPDAAALPAPAIPGLENVMPAAPVAAPAIELPAPAPEAAPAPPAPDAAAPEAAPAP